MATINELKEGLAHIGWKVYENDPINHWIVNNKGNRTNLYVNNLRDDNDYHTLTLQFDNKGMWGEGGLGSLHIRLDNITIKLNKESNALGFYHNDDPKGNTMFLHLYNFDKDGEEE